MEKLTLGAEVFSRSVENIITAESLGKLLASGRKLRIKFGADVTATSLHIGHAVNLWKMRELQDYGHKVVFLIGDFTTTIGDPTGRLEARRKASPEDVDSWAKNFIAEAGEILRTGKKVFEVRKNSEWYSRMKAADLLRLMSFFTHSRMIERDMFKKRMAAGKEIVLTELVYPILQGYDSVMLGSDLTIIGSDQLFNEGAGRLLQEKFGQPPQVLITTTITPGLDGGEKMSKSLGNYIGLADSPQDKFGKTMRLADSLIIPYLKAYTDVPLADIENMERELGRGKNLMEAKLFLASALVRRYHGQRVALRERTKFLTLFSKKEIPAGGIPEVRLRHGEWGPMELLMASGLAPSKSEARRLIRQGAVEVEGKVLRAGEKRDVKSGAVVRVGKKKFVRIV